MVRWLLGILSVVLLSCGAQPVSESAVTAIATTPPPTLAETTTTTATTTPASSSTVVDVPADAPLALLREEPLVREARYNDPGAIVAVDDGYLMFSNQYGPWPPSVEVHLFASEDGVGWVPVAASPVIEFEKTDVRPASFVRSVLAEPDGTWTAFFYSYGGEGATTPLSVGRATAPAAEGPWTVDPEPVFARGDGWDSGEISTPAVLHTDSGYVMFYTGGAGDGPTAIGRAESADGITWERGAEPVFTASPDPDAWDSVRVSQPNLFFRSDGVVVVYKGNSGSSLGQKHGVACLPSLEAGAAWTRAGPDPIIDPTVVPFGSLIFSTEAALIGDTPTLYLEVSTDPSGSSTAVYGLQLRLLESADGAC